MRIVLAVLAGLLLPTACDRPESPPVPAPTPAPLPPTAQPTAPSTTDASVLVLVDAGGAPTATVTCIPEEFRIVVPGFRPIASEERLSLGMDGEAFALVADLSAPGPGVTASGAPDPDLLDRLARGEGLFASYGQQSAGPLTAASAASLQTVISACRRRE